MSHNLRVRTPPLNLLYIYLLLKCKFILSRIYLDQFSRTLFLFVSGTRRFDTRTKSTSVHIGPFAGRQSEKSIVRHRLQLSRRVWLLSASERLHPILCVRLWRCTAGELHRWPDVQPRVANVRLATECWLRGDRKFGTH